MTKLPWLDCYSGETVDELIAYEGKYRIDSLVLAFEQAIDQKSARVGDENLTDVERIIVAIEALEGEVNNGGYDQFFFNTSRKYITIIVDALRSIGCPQTAEITHKAVLALQASPATEDEIESATWDATEELEDALNECDNLYYEGPENIEERLFAFIKVNRERINF